MEGDHIKIWEWLTPLSWLYGIGIGIRNALFDCGILHSEAFDIPVISVGNITVGGTGKTPHTEYLIRLLSKHCQVAILSRGYKRKSKGYILATDEMSEEVIGDEPWQMKHKYPHIHMAVDRDRCNGIRRLSAQEVCPPVDVIILDDAYQHRYVSPGVNILLMDYHRLICFDKLLPAGRLRESQSNKRRADIVIVTKCPPSITPMEQRGIERSLSLYPWQKLFFSYFRYGNLYPLFDKTKPEMSVESLGSGEWNVMLLMGIASPKQMEYDIRKYTDFTPLHFSDHHSFGNKDIELIEDTFRKMPEGRRIVITTEKDSPRLMHCKLSEDFSSVVYVLPVEVDFMNDRADDFNQIITGYVQKNSRNSTLLKGKNADKA